MEKHETWKYRPDNVLYNQLRHKVTSWYNYTECACQSLCMRQLSTLWCFKETRTWETLWPHGCHWGSRCVSFSHQWCHSTTDHPRHHRYSGACHLLPLGTGCGLVGTFPEITIMTMYFTVTTLMLYILVLFAMFNKKKSLRCKYFTYHVYDLTSCIWHISNLCSPNSPCGRPRGAQWMDIFLLAKTWLGGQ